MFHRFSRLAVAARADRLTAKAPRIYCLTNFCTVGNDRSMLGQGRKTSQLSGATFMLNAP